MEEAYITIYNEQPKKPIFSPRIIAIACLCLVIIIATIVIVSQQWQPTAIVEISNYNELELEPPTSVKDNLTQALYRLLTQHFDVPYMPKAIQATSRTDTFHQETTDGIISVSSILDIDQYQQSYDITMSWAEDGTELPENIAVECAPHNISKYPDTKCYGLYHDSDSPYLYLPYSGTLPSGETFEAKFDYEDEAGEHVTINVNDCGDTTLREDALAAVKTYFASMNVSQEDINYDLVSVYNKCLIEN